MKKLAFIALLAILNAPLFAQEQLVEVVQTGYGSTVREATKAALRSAVEAVVGTLVDAQTLVENDKLIEDEILTYSAGMVQSSTAIGEPKKSADGIYAVKLKAVVRKGKLEEKLHAVSSVNMAVSGDDLFARMVSSQNDLEDSKKIMKSVFDKALDVVVAQTVPGDNGKSPIDIDPQTKEVFVTVSVRIDQAKYRLYANEIIENFKPFAESVEDTVIENVNDRGAHYLPGGKGDLVVYARLGKIPMAKTIKLDKNRADFFSSLVVRQEHVLNLAVRVTVFDKLGSDIVSFSKDTNTGNAFYFMSLFGLSNHSLGRDAPMILVPVVGGDYGGSLFSRCYDSVKLKVPLGRFEPEELKNFANIKVDVGWMCGKQFLEK